MNLSIGDIVERLYKYEIRSDPKGGLYAHILDGSKYHLNISHIGNDFKVTQVDVGNTIIDLITNKETIITEIRNNLSWKYHCSNGYCYDRDGFILKKQTNERSNQSTNFHH